MHPVQATDKLSQLCQIWNDNTLMKFPSYSNEIPTEINDLFSPPTIAILGSDRCNRCTWRCGFQHHGCVSGIVKSRRIIVRVRDRDSHGRGGGKFWICVNLLCDHLKNHNRFCLLYFRIVLTKTIERKRSLFTRMMNLRWLGFS